MLSSLTHEMIKNTYDQSKLEERRLLIWHTFIDRLFEIDVSREKKAIPTSPDDIAFQKTGSNTKNSESI